jgi:tetratricopeptide (TPR) repeat protein
VANVEELLRFIATLPARPPAPTQPRRLKALFAELRSPRPRQPPHETETLIWALWSSHADPAAEKRLEQATRALVARDLGLAGRLLQPLVEQYPDWSEAWNKRGTLYYLAGRDEASFADIRRTLELEPRHFGAVCGFAQICLRRGERLAALAAFEMALVLHPQLAGVPAAVADLRETLGTTLH